MQTINGADVEATPDEIQRAKRENEYKWKHNDQAVQEANLKIQENARKLEEQRNRKSLLSRLSDKSKRISDKGKGIDEKITKHSNKVAKHYGHARDTVGKDLWAMTAGSENTSEDGGRSSSQSRPRRESPDHNRIRGSVDSRIVPTGSVDLGGRGRVQRNGPVLDFWKNTGMPIGGDQRMFDSPDNLGISFPWKVNPVTISQGPRRNASRKSMPSRYSKKGRSRRSAGGRTWKKRR